MARLRQRLPRSPWRRGSEDQGPPGPPDWRRRIISGVSIGLVVIGVAVIGYPFWTNLWQDRLQERLGRQLTSAQLANRYRAHRVVTGDSLTRIKIPALGVDMVVVEGTTDSALKAGAGHYPSSPLPCEAGNVA
ncbi:MAG: sortase, partial [Acidimicrobiaceae bacterium]|nr:sortase [Acidimicrobiaceae bacterium]